MPPVRHRQRPARAVVFVGTALLVLGLLEIGQHVVIAPTGIAALAPAIVILMLTAHIEQAVDRARTAEHFSARLEHLPAVQSRFRLGLVHPVDGFFLEQFSIAERHVDPEIVILRSGLQQQHGMFAVGAQAIGEHTSGRAGADDDVVEFGSFIVLVHLFPRTQPERGSGAVTGGQLPPGRGRGESGYAGCFASFKKSGGRRSANATKASRASTVLRRSANRSLSALICAMRSSGLRISRFVALMAPAGCFASCDASAFASASSLSSGTTRLARPQANADLASTASPSANIS